jgi:hypothetical protein
LDAAGRRERERERRGREAASRCGWEGGSKQATRHQRGEPRRETDGGKEKENYILLLYKKWKWKLPAVFPPGFLYLEAVNEHVAVLFFLLSLVYILSFSFF